MNRAIEQVIEFEDTTAQEIFDIYLDPVKHSLILGGSEIKISNKAGDSFSCFDGNVKGKNLMIIPGKLIVQSWRGNVWRKNDPDSILVLSFRETAKGALVHMVHSLTPGQFDDRWDELYWTPIRNYLAQKL